MAVWVRIPPVRLMAISDEIIIDYDGHVIKTKEPAPVVHESGLVFKPAPRAPVSVSELYDYVKEQFDNDLEMDSEFPMLESTPHTNPWPMKTIWGLK